MRAIIILIIGMAMGAWGSHIVRSETEYVDDDYNEY